MKVHYWPKASWIEKIQLQYCIFLFFNIRLKIDFFKQNSIAEFLGSIDFSIEKDVFSIENTIENSIEKFNWIFESSKDYTQAS